MTAERIRRPSGFTPPATAFVDPEAQLLSDRDTLREVASGLDRLEEVVDRTPVIEAAERRGYFTPDEDDRVRQALLAYRNYRLAAFEIILRYRDYANIDDEERRLRCFLVGFGAALVLYAKSLKVVQVAEHSPMLRAKLNEPDAKFDLAAGFFDDVIVGYSSLGNYRAMVNADWFWRSQRRTETLRHLASEPEWRWIPEIIRRKRIVVRKRLVDVLRRRLRYDWRAFWRTALRPARQTRYGFQSLVGGRFAQVHVVPRAVHVLTPGVLAELRPQLRPGDVLLCRAEGKLTAALLPGFWSHAAVFLGTRAELERLGVRTHPHVVARWAEVPEQSGPCGYVIDAVAPRVRICPLEISLNADHVVVLRPNLDETEIAAAIAEAFAHLGKPYDFEFDFNVSTRIVCTELIYRCYHHRGGFEFSLVKRLGRYTLTGDDIVHHALDLLRVGEAARAPFQAVGLILKRRDGHAHAMAEDRVVPLLNRIRKGWRPARRAVA